MEINYIYSANFESVFVHFYKITIFKVLDHVFHYKHFNVWGTSFDLKYLEHMKNIANCMQ